MEATSLLLGSSVSSMQNILFEIQPLGEATELVRYIEKASRLKFTVRLVYGLVLTTVFAIQGIWAQI